MISGDLEPDTGTIKRANDLRVVVFSQHRGTLQPKQTLQEALCPVGDTVDYLGRMVHVTGWAKKFLFRPDQLSTRVELLSGGEQARLLIANLMLEPADVLLMDEPTNDLDIPSLEVLEEAMLEFPGALVLVTHDRFMLERVATELVGLDDLGGARNVADMSQWMNHLKKVGRSERGDSGKAGSGQRASGQGAAKAKKAPKKKLGYLQQREYQGMEKAILEAENQVELLETNANDPVTLGDHASSSEAFKALSAAQEHVKALYERWAELESLQAENGS